MSDPRKGRIAQKTHAKLAILREILANPAWRYPITGKTNWAAVFKDRPDWRKELPTTSSGIARLRAHLKNLPATTPTTALTTTDDANKALILKLAKTYTNKQGNLAWKQIWQDHPELKVKLDAETDAGMGRLYTRASKIMRQANLRPAHRTPSKSKTTEVNGHVPSLPLATAIMQVERRNIETMFSAVLSMHDEMAKLVHLASLS